MSPTEVPKFVVLIVANAGVPRSAIVGSSQALRAHPTVSAAAEGGVYDPHLRPPGLEGGEPAAQSRSRTMVTRRLSDLETGRGVASRRPQPTAKETCSALKTVR
ncbi:hypothetical protein K525DRAFT_275758 [Schizophyllum commune Loenen D]|nr:hypothetical protein K525DRAFT_275758 [Schizophyllum commune Loenen D]